MSTGEALYYNMDDKLISKGVKVYVMIPHSNIAPLFFFHAMNLFLHFLRFLSSISSQQRTHKVEIRPDGIYVFVVSEQVARSSSTSCLDSDKYAYQEL